MYLSNINSKEDKLRKVQVYKKGNLQKCKSTSYFTKYLESEPDNHHNRFWSGCPPRCCGSYTSRVFKGCLVLPETWRTDHLRNHWQTKKVGCWRQLRVWGFHFLGRAKKLL